MKVTYKNGVPVVPKGWRKLPINAFIEKGDRYIDLWMGEYAWAECGLIGEPVKQTLIIRKYNMRHTRLMWLLLSPLYFAVWVLSPLYPADTREFIKTAKEAWRTWPWL